MTNPGLLELSEIQFQNQVTALAEMLGWDWVHFRAGQTRYGWRTPSQGTMAKGWPDLFMVRIRDGRKVIAELKRAGEKASANQRAVLATLAAVGFNVYVWEPKDWPEIEIVLR